MQASLEICLIKWSDWWIRICLLLSVICHVDNVILWGNLRSCSYWKWSKRHVFFSFFSFFFYRCLKNSTNRYGKWIDIKCLKHRAIQQPFQSKNILQYLNIFIYNAYLLLEYRASVSYTIWYYPSLASCHRKIACSNLLPILIISCSSVIKPA